MTRDLIHNPHGLASLWSQSDTVIRTVALLLLIMSIASWVVIALRAWRLWKLRRVAHAADNFWHGAETTVNLQALEGDAGSNPFRHLAEEGQAAVARHETSALRARIGLAEWLTECLRGAIDETTERLQSGLPILASVGSTAPFVGLFGTVWGIYHALISIGTQGQASIDQVAGPVGEALIMTAFGLAVAIPAVLGYNLITRGNKRLLSKMNRFARRLHASLLMQAPKTHDVAGER